MQGKPPAGPSDGPNKAAAKRKPRGKKVGPTNPCCLRLEALWLWRSDAHPCDTWLKLCLPPSHQQVISSDDESDGGSTEDSAPSDDGDDVYEIEAPSPAVAPKVRSWL